MEDGGVYGSAVPKAYTNRNPSLSRRPIFARVRVQEFICNKHTNM